MKQLKDFLFVTGIILGTLALALLLDKCSTHYHCPPGQVLVHYYQDRDVCIPGTNPLKDD